MYTLQKHQKIRTFAIFLKVSDIGKSIVHNGEIYFLNDTSQFCEHILEIYIEKCATIGTSELR